MTQRRIGAVGNCYHFATLVAIRRAAMGVMITKLLKQRIVFVTRRIGNDGLQRLQTSSLRGFDASVSSDEPIMVWPDEVHDDRRNAQRITFEQCGESIEVVVCRGFEAMLVVRDNVGKPNLYL